MEINWNIPKSAADLPLVPLAALTKIGNSLSVATSNEIQYQITRSQKLDNSISHQFYFFVPSLQDFKLLAIETHSPITGYPVKVFDFLNDRVNAFLVNTGRGTFSQASTPDELMPILKSIVETPQCALVIGSLLSEISAQSSLNSDKFGNMRSNNS